MKTRIFHKAHVTILVWLGVAIDIRSRGKWPKYALSNFYHNSFVLDGISCRSMEGFLQSLKCNHINEQILICKKRGKKAKLFGQHIKGNPCYDFEARGVFWNETFINRHSLEYQNLLRRAYRAMLDQCPKFREALLATGIKRLYHTIGNTDPHQTILTEKELCDILTELRSELTKDSQNNEQTL